MQSRLQILILPRQPQVARYRRLVHCRLRRGDAGPAKRIKVGRPDDVACFVGGLQGRAELVVVVVGHAGLACAVFGLDEQGRRAPGAVGAQAVLGGDGGGHRPWGYQLTACHAKDAWGRAGGLHCGGG